MLGNFFQIQPVPLDAFNGQYDPSLVVLSFMVAVFASYIALDFTGRLRDLNNTKAGKILWLLGGALAMGAGIWSMHFIGMLSFTIPGLQLRYDFLWTLLSLLVAISASAFALYLLKKSIINTIHIASGGVILGLAIASMHYTGMEAMLITLNIQYLPGLFLLSILVAIVASEAAIWLALKSNMVIQRFRNRMKIVSAMIMGFAICGMHYTAMAASIFTPLCYTVPTNTASSHLPALDPTILSISIAVVTFIILSVAFFASVYKESINQQQFEIARQLGMAEISASVLHNVGNVLNSVNISVETILAKNATSQAVELEKLCALLNAHKDNLGEFIIQDPRGMQTLYFLNKLAEYWHAEQHFIKTTAIELLKNLQIIKDTISTQQGLSKVLGTEQITRIDEILDEALLITGFMGTDIDVKRDYGKSLSVVLDKVKLMQVIVNLLRNAKDSLMEASNQKKTLTIKTAIINNHPKQILIQITDNGIGIPPSNLNKIFNYGFTTKKLGHGFGLHASAIAINDLGGEIRVDSAGVAEGTTFSLKIPYKKEI